MIVSGEPVLRSVRVGEAKKLVAGSELARYSERGNMIVGRIHDVRESKRGGSCVGLRSVSKEGYIKEAAGRRTK